MKLLYACGMKRVEEWDWPPTRGRYQTVDFANYKTLYAKVLRHTGPHHLLPPDIGVGVISPEGRT
jgi:hypothetical protein